MPANSRKIPSYRVHRPTGQAVVRPQPVAPEETRAAAAVLRAAGWRVVTVDASTPLALAWQRLPRFSDQAGGLSAAYSDPSLRMA